MTRKLAYWISTDASPDTLATGPLPAAPFCFTPP
jgi:hypothetical protein